MTSAGPHQPPQGYEGGVAAVLPGVWLRSQKSVASERAEDDWPHTTRALPWLLATFLAALFLIPVDEISLPIHLPFDSKLDRVIVGLMVVVWVGKRLSARSGSAKSRRPTLIHVALLVYLAVALASILVNVGLLTKLDEYNASVKQLAVLLSFTVFFCVAASSIRPTEVNPFVTFMITLAALTAIGTIYEYHTNTNVFFNWTNSVLPPGVELTFAQNGIDSSGRQGTTGPTQHGLALATMMSLVIPFVVVRFTQARTFVPKLYYAAVVILLFAAALATERKSAVLVPAVVLLVLIAYRPQAMLRALPVLAIVVAVVPIFAPGALTKLKQHLVTSQGFAQDESTKSRTEDYDAVTPDIRSHLALGRGVGSYSSTTYRYLDNQYLSVLIETGALGLGAFILTLVAVVAVAHPLIRSNDPIRGPPAVAVAAATGGFAVATFFYTSLGFVQVPYLFFFLAALVAACAAPREQQPVPDPERLEGVPA